MKIQFLEDLKIFRLDTEHVSYLFQIGPAGELRHIWYGAPVEDEAFLTVFTEKRDFAFSPYPEGLNRQNSLDTAPMEYSTFGSGDYRITASALRKTNGTSVTSAVYHSHRIYSGKPALRGLPSSFGADQDIQTLEITMKDGFSGAEIILSYSIFADSDVIARSVRVVNTTDAPITLDFAYKFHNDCYLAITDSEGNIKYRFDGDYRDGHSDALYEYSPLPAKITLNDGDILYTTNCASTFDRVDESGE